MSEIHNIKKIIFIPYAMYSPHRSVACDYAFSKNDTDQIEIVHCPSKYQKQQCRFNKKGSRLICLACTLSYNGVKSDLKLKTDSSLQESKKLPSISDLKIFDQLIDGAISSHFSSHKKLSIEGTDNISELLDTAKNCFEYFDALFSTNKKVELILFNGRVELTWAACQAALVNGIPFKVLEVLRQNSSGGYTVEVAQNTLTHDPDHVAVQLQSLKKISATIPIKHVNMHGNVKVKKHYDRKTITVFLKTFNEFHALGAAYAIPNASTQAAYILKLQKYCQNARHQLIIKHHPNARTDESQYSQLEERVYERLNSMGRVIYYPPGSNVDSHHLAANSDLNISFGGSISRYCLENEYPVLLTKPERFLCYQDANQYIVPLELIIERCDYFFQSGLIPGWTEMINSLNRFNNWRLAGGIELEPTVKNSYIKKFISLLMISSNNSNRKARK